MGKIIPNTKYLIPKLLLLFFIFSFFYNYNFAYGYSLGDQADSFFNRNPLQFSPFNVNTTRSDPSGLTFDDLVNAGSFSSKDISASIKAVLILFIKLIVTTLNVTLGILKALLAVLTKVI